MTPPLLRIEDLTVAFGANTAVRLSLLEVAQAEIVGLAGESGAGKSLTGLSVLGLTRLLGARVAGSICLDGEELLNTTSRRLRELRGSTIALIPQSPTAAFSPMQRVGVSLMRALRLHGRSRSQARSQASTALRRVRLDENHLRRYPHQLSGGQLQRVAIALALALGARILIADEPTSALDVTVQGEILALLDELRHREGLAVLIISHDLAALTTVCDRIAVMRGGCIVEQDSTHQLITRPQQAYTRTLLAAVPRLTPDPLSSDVPGPRTESLDGTAGSSTASTTRPLLEARNLSLRLGRTLAVAGVSLTLPIGPYGLGVIGESGAGKTTLGRALLGLTNPSSGTVRFDGADVPTRGDQRVYRRAVQGILQDSDGSLSPRLRAGQALAEVLRAHRIVPRAAQTRRVRELLAEVGLGSEHIDRFPHQLSGGQRQRLAIARALALRPRALVLDEPTSALDVTVQDRILSLLQDLRDRHHLSYLLISHDLAVVQRLCDHVAVMRGGTIVEQGPTEMILRNPRHPYTRTLINAVPALPT